MGRWTQYDEDFYRLPEGVTRTGYDADTGRYLFNGVPGIPHTRYGVLARGERSSYSQHRKASRKRLREPLVLPILPSNTTREPSEKKPESASKSINVPNAMRALRRAILASLTFSRRRSRKHPTKGHAGSTESNSTAGVEKKPSVSQETSYTGSISKEKPSGFEKSTHSETSLSKKATTSVAPRTHSRTAKGEPNTSPPSSSPPGECGLVSESHTRSISHDSKNQVQPTLRRQSASAEGASQPPIRRSSRASTANKSSAERPTRSREATGAQLPETEMGDPTTPSVAVLTGKKSGITDPPVLIAPHRAVTRSSTLPTQSTSRISEPRTSPPVISLSPSTREKPHTAALHAGSASQPLSQGFSAVSNSPSRQPGERSDVGKPASRTRSYPLRERSHTAQPPSHSSSQIVTSTRTGASEPHLHTSSRSQSVKHKPLPPDASSRERVDKPNLTAVNTHTPSRVSKDNPVSSTQMRSHPSRRRREAS